MILRTRPKRCIDTCTAQGCVSQQIDALLCTLLDHENQGLSMHNAIERLEIECLK
jgi:hypothetical protein